MADSNRWAAQALIFGGTSDTDVPFVPGSLQVGNTPGIEQLMSGNTLTPDIRQIVQKKPFISAKILDPSQLTAIAAVGSGETITSVRGIYRVYDQNGGPGSTYISYSGAQGFLIPQTLSFSAQSRAVMDILFMAAFSGGTGLSRGTSSDAAATVSKSYYPTSLVLGGSTTINDIQDGQVVWDYGIEDENEFEPSYYMYTKTVRTLTLTALNVDDVTAARLEDGVRETAVLTLTNRESGGGTVSINLGTALTFASIDGDRVSITCSEVTG